MMKDYLCSSRLSFLLVSCFLLFGLVACSQNTTNQSHNPAHSVATMATKSAPSATLGGPGTNKTVSLHSAQTDCPSSGLARAALLNSFVHGTNPTLIYTSNDVSRDASTSVGVLKRYDTKTQRTSVLAVSGYSISNAQVSADGQWVLFLSQGNANRGNAGPGTGSRLQLVRVDGAGLQTLYCAPAAVTINGIHWSEDQKHILLDSLDGNTNTSTIRLLDTGSGTLTTELQAPLGPGAFKTLLWLDNTHAYIRQEPGETQHAPQPILYLLDMMDNKDVHGGNLKKVSDFPISGGDMRLESSADKSPDSRTLFLSHCFSNGVTLTSKITAQPANGGPQQDVYQNLPGCIKDLRALSTRKLLFTIRVPDGGFSKEIVVLANTDGSGTTALYNNSGAHTSIQLNHHAQLPWSNVSRDGDLYAFNEQGAILHVSRLLIGSFSTGKLTTLVSNPAGTVSVAGWTTM
ncbi:MAG: hypothetical protein NVSMB44_33770 [Ktedonobacteraceae bacterium]